MQQDRIVGIGLLAGGAVLLYETFSFRVNDWEPLGMAFWPRVLLAVLGLCAVFLIAKGRLDDGPFLSVHARSFLALGIGVAYVVLLPRIGFLLLTPAFLFATSLLIGRELRWQRLVEAAALALVTTLVLDLVFKKVLLVQLPEGLWG
ncbi:MAG: tripartite tricarboxylate transporter TctB family protein [Geminicoccaceae bacterium]